MLTLASPVVYGDFVTVTYTKPALIRCRQPQEDRLQHSVFRQSLTKLILSTRFMSALLLKMQHLLLLEMTYNMTLANIAPLHRPLSVLVNSVARTVSTVAISGTKVLLTLASPVVYGDLVTVTYTKPTLNPLQTASGGQAANISVQPVTNSVNSVNPVYVSSAIENATPSTLGMTYNMTLANISPAASSFTVLVNSIARTVSTVAISATKVLLTLASPVVYGDLVTVTYTKPTLNPLQTASGGQAANISVQPVTNSVNSVNPVYVSSAIENATPSTLGMTYNMTLANIAPAASSFTVLVNSVARAVSTVAVSATKVQLTLVSRINPGDIVTVSYTKPATNPIQTTSGGIAVSISSQQVVNNCINAVPTAVITNPVMNSSFTSPTNILITANASDTDGSVSLVEFYNGSTRLGSKSSAPYSFAWNNVTAGNYSITVVATDNLNAKTVSSAISISVVNNTTVPNQRPVVKINNPRKGNKYEKLSSISIDAIASDPDGTIKKVEFYNGSVKLVELTSAPYSYTWKDIPAGNYCVTAIATDNLNDTTISSPIEFIVVANVRYDANSEIINLFPNPNDGHFSIEFINPLLSEKGEIVISDLAGKQVYRGPILKEEISKQFDLSDSKSGMYVMIIKDKDILTTKKFIKK